MAESLKTLRDRISRALTEALQPLPTVLAGWEGGSAAFGAVDDYSDIDLTLLVDDSVAFETLYAAAEKALETISPIASRYTPSRGRYYKLRDVSEYLLIDLIFIRTGDPDHYLEVERHGPIIPLFDKGNWLGPRTPDENALAAKRDKRYRELQIWFHISQGFVRKAILRGHQVEAVSAFWAYTLKPLAELLRMRFCPARWDFGTRYLDRDLSPALYARFCDLVFARDLDELDSKLTTASAWGDTLLKELEPVSRCVGSDATVRR